MWILLATVCSTDAVDSCQTLVWLKQSFLTEDACMLKLEEQTPGLEAQGFTWVNPRCSIVPGQTNS